MPKGRPKKMKKEDEQGVIPVVEQKPVEEKKTVQPDPFAWAKELKEKVSVLGVSVASLEKKISAFGNSGQDLIALVTELEKKIDAKQAEFPSVDIEERLKAIEEGNKDRDALFNVIKTEVMRMTEGMKGLQ